jgi:High potential iron-sulfur protein
MTTTRRSFIATVAAAGATVMTNEAFAQTKMDEANGQAISLGYMHDTTKVDGKKYPKHEKSQQCSTCMLWQSKASDPWGNCPLFAGKQVNAKGWCRSWAKRA